MRICSGARNTGYSETRAAIPVTCRHSPAFSKTPELSLSPEGTLFAAGGGPLFPGGDPIGSGRVEWHFSPRRAHSSPEGTQVGFTRRLVSCGQRLFDRRQKR